MPFGCDPFSWLQCFPSTLGWGDWRRRLLAWPFLQISFQPWKRDQRHSPELPARAFVSTFPLQRGTKRKIFCVYYFRLWSHLVDVAGTLFTARCPGTIVECSKGKSVWQPGDAERTYGFISLGVMYSQQRPVCVHNVILGVPRQILSVGGR